MKKLLTFLTLLTLFFTTAGAETSILSFTAECGGTGTADDGAVWTITSDAAESNFLDDGIHYGTGKVAVKYLQLQTSDIIGTITNVKVMAKDAQGTGVITVTVGGTAFEFVPTTAHPSNTVTNSSGQTYEFTGSGSGEIVVKIERPNAQTKAIYCKSVTVQYTPGSTPAEKYSITVNQPAEGGQISADKEEATEGTTVNLTATPASHYAFGEWIVKDANNNNVAVTDNQFTMPASNVTVTASFTALQAHAITVTGGSATPTTAYAGETVTLTPTLPDGQVVDWDATTVSPNGLEINHSNYKFTMPNEAVTIAFAFKDAPLEATYIFNTDAGLAALGITAPTSGGTDLEEGLNYTSGIVTMTTTHGSTNTRIWYNNSTGLDLRIYGPGTGNNTKPAGTLSFAIANGYNITQLDITYGDKVGGFTASTGEFNDGYTTWTGEAQSVTLTATDQSRIKTITVTYAEDANPPATVDYYLVGNINGWDNENLTANSPYKFTKQNDGSYTLNVTLPDLSVDNDLIRFKIAKVENGTPTWYGGSGNGDYGINRKWGNNTNITFGNGDQAFTVPDCYNAIFTLDAENTKFSVDKPQLYMIGTFNDYVTPDNDSDNGAAVLTPNTENGGWTLTKEFAANAEFRLYDAWHVHHGGNGWWIQEEHYGTELDIVNDNTSIFRIVNAGNYTITVNSGLTKLKAEKIVEKYTATIASGINGGSVSFNENYQRNTLSDITEGQTVNVYVTPNTDYELESLTYTVEGEDPVEITATDVEGQYSFTMPAANVTINAEFTFNGVVTETTYQLVKSNTDLELNGKYIIVNKTNHQALGIVGNNQNKGVDITIVNDVAVIASNSGVSEFVLGSYKDAYTFKNGTKYLDNPSSTTVNQNGEMNENPELSDNIDWSININNGTATIQNGGTTRYLRYYTDSGYFRAYTSITQNGTSDIQLFKAVNVTETTLADLIDLGASAEGKLYTISDANGLLGVYKSGNTIWFKDEIEKTFELTNETLTIIGGSVNLDEPGDEQNYWINNVRTKAFDQSNWIEVDFSNVEIPEAVTGQEPNVYIQNLTGTYSYNNGNPKLVLTETPAAADVKPVTDPTKAYNPNPYIPASFEGTQKGYFFSKPKVQEYAYFVKAQWDGSKMVMTSNTEYNPEGFTGSFSIKPVNGLDENSHVGDFYQFHGIVRKSGTVGSPRLKAEGDDIEVETTDLNPENVVTAISTVAVSGEVKSVKYVNVAGVVSDRPFQGVNIVVTEYTDGSRTTAKMVR